MHTAEYMCKEYGVQCKQTPRELKAIALAAKAAKRREHRIAKRQHAPQRRSDGRSEPAPAFLFTDRSELGSSPIIKETR